MHGQAMFVTSRDVESIVDPELWSLPEEWPARCEKLPPPAPRSPSQNSLGPEHLWTSQGLVTDVEDELIQGVGLDIWLSGWGRHWSDSGKQLARQLT